jgi:hypothetical protein
MASWRGIGLLVGLFSGFGVWGQVNPHSAIPPLFNLSVYQSESDPQHYVILGCERADGLCVRWVVLDWKNGQVTVPELTDATVVSESGGVRLSYATGEWLNLPEAPLTGRLLAANEERTLPGLISPETGREPLSKIPLSLSLIDGQLQISHFVATEHFRELKASAIAHPSAKYDAAGNRISLLVLNLKGKGGPSTEEEGLAKELGSQKEFVISAEIYRGERNELLVWVLEPYVSHIQSFANSALSKSFEVRQAFTVPGKANPQAPLPDMDTLSRKTIFQQLELIQRDFDRLDNDQTQFVAGEASSAVEFTAIALELLEALLNRSYQVRSRLAAWGRNEAALESVEQGFAMPLSELIRKGHRILFQRGKVIPDGRRELLFGESLLTDRFQYLEKPSGSFRDENGTRVEDNYFELWLRICRGNAALANPDKTQFVGRATPRSKSGALLGFLPGIELNVSELHPTVDSIAGAFKSETDFPLLVLGSGDRPQYVAALVNSIIEMDTDAEAGMQSNAWRKETEIRGGLGVFNLIQGLANAPRWPAFTNDIPNFSRAVYFTQAMRVVRELLNVSQVSIKNSVTYLSLLNSGFELTQKVKAEFGELPNAAANTLELNALTLELVSLMDVLNVRMVRAALANPSQWAVAGCPEALLNAK